ncbi:MAG: protein kinase domain-containing protein [Myxococcota bacterium]
MTDEAAATPEKEDSLIGSVVAGKYRIDRLIGRGGMGAVFQATHLAIGKRVALKFLNRDAARDAGAAERFQREALAASVVESSHIVQIFDSGTSEDGSPFLVMELLAGEDLRARLRREGKLEPEIATSIAAQVLRALVRAHAGGIVHRDLKPDNVFLCQRDDGTLFVKIVDFGVSKLARGSTLDTLTQRGTVLGTVYYMSPEQAQAFPDVDGRTDLFSLGAILYECLTGRPPHQAPTYESVLVAICTKDPEDVRSLVPECSRGLANVIKRALARDRAQRFASAQEMLDALSSACPDVLTPRTDSTRAAAGPVLVSAGVEIVEPFASTSRAESGVRGHRARTIAVAVVALLSGFALTALWVGQRRSASHLAEELPSSRRSLAAITPSPVLAAPSANETSEQPAPVPSAEPADKALPQRNAPPAGAPRRTQPRPSTERSTPPKRGVAGDLELSNREP